MYCLGYVVEVFGEGWYVGVVYFVGLVVLGFGFGGLLYVVYWYFLIGCC